MNLMAIKARWRCVGLIVLLAGETAQAAPASGQTMAEPPAVPAVLLVEPREATPLDAQIRASQLRLKRTAQRAAELERLGWLFVAKARASSDPGFYTLAGIAADALERDYRQKNESRLLRGHVLQTQHRFAEAAELGRQLVTDRGAPADYALLGDALYDQGRIGDAASAYQRMVDLKPSLDSYTRAANIRWIKGDLAGAIELQSLAVRSGGPGDSGALAWTLVRLAQLVWQQGNSTDASALVLRALELVPDFQPASLLQGRLLLAAGKVNEALAPLERAARILPLPEPRWIYAEALREVGRVAEADTLEALLVAEGVAEDPRTVAQFLTTRGRDLPLAARLAAAELNNRRDVFTHGANAFVLAAMNRLPEASVHRHAALAEGTIDARLLLQVGRAAALQGERDAAELLAQADRLSHLLLPSERRLLAETLLLLPANAGAADLKNKNTNQKTS